MESFAEKFLAVKRQVILFVLGMDGINLLFANKTLKYLARELKMDEVSPYSTGASLFSFHNEIGLELVERRKLFTHQQLRLCRKLAEAEIIDRSLVDWLEQTLSLETMSQEACLIMNNGSFENSYHWGGITITKDDEETGETIVISQTEPSLPWERDVNFFDDHPEFKKDQESMDQEKTAIGWYAKLWQAFLVKPNALTPQGES